MTLEILAVLLAQAGASAPAEGSLDPEVVAAETKLSGDQASALEASLSPFTVGVDVGELVFWAIVWRMPLWLSQTVPFELDYRLHPQVSLVGQLVVSHDLILVADYWLSELHGLRLSPAIGVRYRPFGGLWFGAFIPLVEVAFVPFAPPGAFDVVEPAMHPRRGL